MSNITNKVDTSTELSPEETAALNLIFDAMWSVAISELITNSDENA